MTAASELPSGKAEIQSNHKREFHISPKTPHEWLAGVNLGSSFDSKDRLAGDIILNVTELEPGIDWNDTLNNSTYVFQGRKLHGKNIITFYLASKIGFAASRMGWDMHSPQVVYMSGYFFQSTFSSRLNQLKGQLEDFNRGERKFVSKETEYTALTKEAEETTKLGTDLEKISASLEEFKNQYLPENETYLKILQSFTRLPASYTKDKILNLLKGNKIQEASDLLDVSKQVASK